MTTKKRTRTNEEALSKAYSVRHFEADMAKLLEYEKKGLNPADLIRRCVRKSLADVVREIKEDLERSESGR